MLYRKRCPDHPWLTKQADHIIDAYLKKSDTAFEFGSGRSTIWFAKRVSFMVSVEHDPVWYNKISVILKEQRASNFRYILHEFEYEKEEDYNTKYVKEITKMQKNSLGVVLVDGLYRSACCNEAIEFIRPGGILVLDDANWFLPSNSVAPNSIDISSKPLTLDFEKFLARVKDWRCIWTGNGVQDTAIYFKP